MKRFCLKMATTLSKNLQRSERAIVNDWCLHEIYGNECYIGNGIENLMEIFKKMKNPKIFCENLKVQGNFIMYYLLKNGFKFKNNIKECSDFTFTALISNNDEYYKISIYWKKTNKKAIKIDLVDMQKLFKFNSLTELSETFKYKFEENNIISECKLLAYSVEQFFKISSTEKLTIGSCCIENYKKFIGIEKFKKWFPIPSINEDNFYRLAFFGGYNFLNPEFQGRKNEISTGGLVYDLNSIYPFIMMQAPLPYGTPLFYSGEYEENEKYPLYIQHLRCMFELKKDFLPTISSKNLEFNTFSKYLENSKNSETGEYEFIDLFLTNIDIEIFFKHYDVFNVEFVDGVMFKSSNLMFKDWIKMWNDIKEKADTEKNKGKRKIAKLYMNNLYGKFATNPIVKNKFPYIGENNILNLDYIFNPLKNEKGELLFEDNEIIWTNEKIIDPVYIPVSAFITAYGRYLTINASQEIHYNSIKETGKSRFIYSDTDSIHLLGYEIPKELNINNQKIGKWKLETAFKYGRYLEPKRYILYEENGKKHVICAGMTESCANNANWKNFNYGNSIQGHEKYCNFVGGTLKKPCEFTL